MSYLINIFNKITLVFLVLSVITFGTFAGIRIAKTGMLMIAPQVQVKKELNKSTIVVQKSNPQDSKKINAIVRLETESGHFFCSGSVINNEYIMTAGHCLVNSLGYMSSKTIKIKDSNLKDTGVEAEAVAINNRLDYGLIKVTKGDLKNFNKVTLEPSQEGVFKSTMPYVAMGYPHGGQLHTVPLFPKFVNEYFYEQFTGRLYPGMSGGAVIDGRGYQVGINSAVGIGHVLITPVMEFFASMDLEVRFE